MLTLEDIKVHEAEDETEASSGFTYGANKHEQ